ncbi:ABC transporter substrate-binding protein [Paenibacillus sp. YIM B09110]|uniref:ABC transporter substrate-binding protein n=1 Tax=Paenibacillus sp. YIM B09110 TaxID=3126102 RepID=UPI00301E1C69
MKKKLLPVVLASSLLAVGIIGCSNNNGNSTENSTAPNNASVSEESGQIDFNEEPYTIKVNYAVLGQEQADLPKIEEKLNEITLKEINAKVDLEGVSLFNMANVYALKASSREKTDLMLLMPGSSYLPTFANNKMIRPISEELAQWGPAIQETVGDLLPAGKFKGEQYTIPQRMDQQLTIGFNMNKSILDKYNIDIASIKSLDDMDAVFAKVQEGEPNMTMLAPETSSANIAGSLVYSDMLGSNYGVLMDGTGTKLINQYESEQMINTIKKVREWYQKGYISKDVSTSQDDGSTLLHNGKVFANAVYSVGFAGGLSVPIETRTVAMHPAVRKTTDSQLFLWAVASSSERPDKAIQFLNLLNSSAELTKLLSLGIEGEHYEVKADGIIDTSKNTNYNQNNWLMFGDYNKLPLRQLYVEPTGLSPEAYKEGLKKWNEDTTLSPAYGFLFDPSSVKTEISALDAVNEQYAKIIGNGGVDPDELLKKFNDELYAAGLQKVIDEKQRQLDAWLAEEKK